MADSNQPNQDNQPVGASGSPASDRVKVEQTDIPSAGVVGLDPATTQQEFTTVLNDLEMIIQRIQGRLSFHNDVSTLQIHLDNARKWLAKELNYDVQPDGTVLAPAGTAANPSLYGQSTGNLKENQNTDQNKDKNS